MVDEGSGHYEFLRERAERIAEANPHLAKRILGERALPPERPATPPPIIEAPPVIEPTMERPARLTARRIISVVAAAWEVHPARITSPERTLRVTRPRFACFWLLKQHLGLSTTVIGRLLGKRDHTTTIHGLRRARTLHLHDADWRQRYEAACTEIARFT